MWYQCELQIYARNGGHASVSGALAAMPLRAYTEYQARMTVGPATPEAISSFNAWEGNHDKSDLAHGP